MPSSQVEELADAAKSLLEQIITDPFKRFYDVRREMIAWALAARKGAYKIEFDRRVGPYGDICFTNIDTRNLRWAEGYHPHDPRCPWVYEKARIRTDLVPLMEGWDNTENLRGDSGGASSRTANPGSPGTVVLDSNNPPNMTPSREFTYTTVVYMYERHLGVTKRIKGGVKKLKPGERYMVCTDPNDPEVGCGYRSDTQKDQRRDGTLGPGEELPPHEVGACPGLAEGMDCGLDLKRVDQEPQEYDDEGEHRYTVFAPYESGDDGPCRILVEPQPWPYDTRTVPYVVWDCYTRPFKPMGPSETSINKSIVMGLNLLDRMGLETMMLSRPVWDVPNDRIDFVGERWQFGDAQGLCAYHDPFAPAQSKMELVQAPGLPGAWPQLRSTLDGDLREDMGINDVSFGPGETKDIPVGTARLQERLGEIPVDDQAQTLRRAESFGQMVTLDIATAAYTEKRLLRMKGKDGSRVFNMFRAADLPRFDVIVTTDPNALQFRAEEVDGLKKVFDPSVPPPMQKFLARALNVPASTIKEYQAEMQQWQEEQMAKMGPPPGMGGPPPGPGGPPPPMGGRMGPAIPAGLAPPTNGAPI